MSRPLRIEFAGALYHITSRGNRQEAICLDETDRHAWLALLGDVYASDLDAAAVEGDKLKQWVLDNWMLSDHAEEWLAALMPH